jgi:hypothetical protein
MILGDIRMLGVAAFLVISILPGAWISFGLPLQRLSFWARLLLGVLLAPIVIVFEFYPVRLLGASFERTALILVLINLPALILIWRHARRIQVPDGKTWLAWTIAVLLSVACMVPAFAHPQTVMYRGHSWLYTGPIYSLAKGELVLEDPDLAGYKMGYPVWSGLIQQAFLSYFLDSPPMCSFIWTSLVCIIVSCGFAMGIVEELGGGWIAKISSGVWLLLGSNSVGYVLKRLLPGSFTSAVQIWGDGRYTPWVWKFHDFNSMPLILAICTGLVYLLIRQTSERLSKDSLLVICLLLICVGVFYPILYPAACALLGARALAALLEKSEANQSGRFQEFVALAVVLLISAAVTFANYKFLTHERVVTGLVQISNLGGMARKALEYFVVTSPLLAGFVLTFRTCWKERRTAFIVLGLGALGSLFLTAFFYLPYWTNEYKFMFTAAICLAPFPSLATEHLWKKLGAAKTLPIVGLAFLFFAAAYAHQMVRQDWSLRTTRQATTDSSHFFLRLDPKERLSGIYRAVEERTPPNTVLAIQNADWHPPTFTNRSIYIAYESKPFGGVNQGNDVLIDKIKGFGSKVIRERRQTLADLYESTENAPRAQAVSRLLEMKRPMAIILEPQHAALLAWLQANTSGSAIFQENGLTLWLIVPGPS